MTVNCSLDLYPCKEEKKEFTRTSSVPQRNVSKDPGYGWRHIQLLLIFATILGLFTHRSCLSVAIVAMTEPITPDQEIFPWSRKEQGTVLDAYLWGYAALQVPAGYLTSRFGAKRLMGISLLGSSVLLMCIPIVSRQFGWQGVAAVRIMMGVVQGVTYPGTYTLLGKWAVPQERSRASALAMAAHAAGIFIAMALSGYIAVSLGWPIIFYIFGSLTVVVGVCWLVFCADDPESHPWISEAERKYIVDAIGNESKITKGPTPWREILTSIPFHSLFLAYVGYVWGQWKLLTALPRYMNDMFQFTISLNGLVSGAPYLFSLMVGIASGWLSDAVVNRGYISTGFARKMFNSIGFWGPALSFVALNLTPDDYRGMQVVELILAVGFFGAAYSGLMVNFVDLSPRFSGLILAVCNALSSLIAAVALPVREAFIDAWGEKEGWTASFYLAAAILFITNGIWVIWGTSKQQPWNDVKKKETNEKTQL